jgi:hypothetical protein
MKSIKYLTLSGTVLALVFSAGIAAAKDKAPVFTISGGADFTIGVTSGEQTIPVGTTGYSNALLTTDKNHEYTFTFMGCGNADLENRFVVIGNNHSQDKTHRKQNSTSFDCSTSKIGDSFKAKLDANQFGAHMPFYFQAGAELGGPSIFNGEGPFDGTFTGGHSFSNMSIFYAIEGSTSDPGETTGAKVLLGLSDGGVTNDTDYQDLVVEVSGK